MAQPTKVGFVSYRPGFQPGETSERSPASPHHDPIKIGVSQAPLVVSGDGEADEDVR
jgi:hypothetical protein